MAERSGSTKEVGRVNVDAAGIDLGSRSHYVALPEDRSERVRIFGCYTEDLEAMAKWLKLHRIATVAMEATGVYWVPVYQLLEKHGLEVVLVNAQLYKSVPGRKTDVQDCQWLQHLHELGLLRGSFRPADAICVVRTYARQRETLIARSTECTLRMQKALDQMNVQLHKVLSDITGETGMAIIEDILKGERDPEKLAMHRNYRCKREPAEIIKALRGDFRPEHLFCLKQEHGNYREAQKQILEVEDEMMKCWKDLESQADISELPTAKTKKDDNEARRQLFRMTGCDLTALPGFSTHNLQSIIAEVGTDMTKWPTEHHFASWMRLCPPNAVTGGKRRRRVKVPLGPARAALQFRNAAHGLSRSHTALGGYYRRRRAQKGPEFAMKVTAHKLAKLFYRHLRYGKQYEAPAEDYYEKKYENRMLNNAIRRLKTLGYSVNITKAE